MPEPLESISDRLFLHAGARPETVALTRLKPDGTPAESMNFRELDRRTRARAQVVSERGEQGRPVLVPERNGCAYVLGYLACLRAGAIAVTAYRPRSTDRSGRLQRIIEDARPSSAFADKETIEIFANLDQELLPAGSFIATDEPHEHAPDHGDLPTIDPNSIAMLQYTSGSTSSPRAVAITHANLVANLSVMTELFFVTGSTATVCWLPLFHDMGLLGLVMSSVVNGITTHLMAPEEFVMHPLRWLKAISLTRASHSGGPNFAFDICVDRTTPEQREGLDLSCWKSAMNGAEPIRPESIERFLEAFGPYGFDSDALQPCYGLAESTLVVATRRREDPLRIPRISTKALQQHRIEESEEEDTRAIVTCGPPVTNHDVRITTPEGDSFLEDGHVGEICVRGASVACGYHEHNEETKCTFVAHLGGVQGPWLRTGDLGAFLDGELLVVGRLKDLIIIGGMNHHPQDIERTAEIANSNIASGGCAAFAVDSSKTGCGEQVVILVEPSRKTYRAIRRDERAVEEMAAAIEGSIRAEISSVHGVSIAHCVFVAPGTILRTTSGKIRRGACSKAWTNGEIQSFPG
jgi:acyl-CoA synthetase (AMP-forming)/AMP-acid ligase II